MSRTQPNGAELQTGSVPRSVLNTTQAGSAVIAKVIAGSNLALSSTGADSGTGDVTVALAATALSTVTASTLASTITAYTLALTDAGTTVETTASSAVTVTVPLNASVAFPARTVIAVRQYGTGQITIAGASGVTLRQTSSLTSRAQYSTIYLEYRGSDEWIVDGGTT